MYPFVNEMRDKRSLVVVFSLHSPHSRQSNGAYAYYYNVITSEQVRVRSQAIQTCGHVTVRSNHHLLHFRGQFFQWTIPW